MIINESQKWIVAALKKRITTAHETQARYLAMQRDGINHSEYNPLTNQIEIVTRRFFSWEFQTLDPLGVVLDAERRLMRFSNLQREELSL